ncbi:MAG: hypothetical protein KIT09_21755 [Bryobacteraceae bacterium]|nr:hypothetical protein [Bryobacteraceae bacterium]
MERETTLTTADLAGMARREEPPPERAETPRTDEEWRQAPLFAEDRGGDLRRRWDAIQTSFVDDPRRSVEEADSLVAEAMRELAETFSKARSDLEQQWSHGDGEASTEDLRQALRRYRSFFHRMLAI